MTDLQILYEFLISLLPTDLVARSLALAPVVVALVGLLRRIPWFALRKRWAAPVAALVLGQGLGYWAVGFEPASLLTGAGVGLVITLAAIGGFSTAKNALQSLGSGGSQAAAPVRSAIIQPERPWPDPPGTAGDPARNRTRTTSRR